MSVGDGFKISLSGFDWVWIETFLHSEISLRVKIQLISAFLEPFGAIYEQCQLSALAFHI
jgi:hypothetical protein